MNRPYDGPDLNVSHAGQVVLSTTELNGLTRTRREQGDVKSQFGSVSDVKLLWTRLLFTVHHPSVSDKHLTAACNAVCFFVRTLANAAETEYQDFACSDTRWMECFEAARSAFTAGKTKPALQVLDTLAHLAKHDAVKNSASARISAAATQMVRTIYMQQPRKTLKDACIIIYFFLRKLSDSFSFPEVLSRVFSETRSSFLQSCRNFSVPYDTSVEDTDSNWMSFILSLLMIMSVAESKTAVLKLLSLICTDPTHSENNLPVLVQKAVELYGASNEKALENINQDILPSIITSRDHFYAFLPAANSEAHLTSAKINLILSQVKLGLLKTYVTETELPPLLCKKLSAAYVSTENGDPCQFEIFTRLMSNTDPDVRQNACDLLLSSISLKNENTAGALVCLMQSLPALHDDNDAYHRGELYSVFRRFILRAYQRLTAITKSGNPTQDSYLTVIDDFLAKYIQFLGIELMPSLSYGRHILALDILCFISKNFEPLQELQCFSALGHVDLQKALFRLVLDPYNDIREASTIALSYLVRLSPISFDTCIRQLLPLEASQILAANTNRADHADALGRLMSLLSKSTTLLIEGSQDGKESLSSRSIIVRARSLDQHVNSMSEYHVSSQYALHGVILGLSYSLVDIEAQNLAQESADLQMSLLSTCRQIWSLSQLHLCVDSPEIEIDTEQEEHLDFGPKDVLAYAWRALRDSNILMQAMLNSLNATSELLKTVGDICFEQLCLLRHRGAFSTVAQTFLLCCHKARNDQSRHGQLLVEGWFDRALLELESQANKLTRRSAGLPALFTALLNSQQQANFLTQFNALILIAEQDVPVESADVPQDKMRLPQVHALNCIKDIITNSRFRTVTEMLVMQTTDLAARCMGSQIWAIKNCGLMLLRASISRLDPETTLGVSEAGLNIRNGPSTGKTPLDVAIFLLTGLENSYVAEMKTKQAVQTEAEFAGLDLLGRLYIHKDDTDKVKGVVVEKLGHPLWHIRAQAARLLIKMTPAGDELRLLAHMAAQLSQLLIPREIHGRLLVYKAIVYRGSDSVQPEEYLEEMVSQLIRVKETIKQSKDATVCATWLSMINRTTSLRISKELNDKLRDAVKEMMLTAARRSGSRSLEDEETALYLLQTCEPDNPKSSASAVVALQGDENVAINALNRIAGGSMTPGMLVVLANIITAKVADRVRACAMDALGSYLLNYSRSFAADGLAIVNNIRFDMPISRSLLLSQLNLYSSLCQHAWLSRSDVLKVSVSALGTGFCLHLRYAARDDLEETTRRTAVEALLNLTSSPGASDMLTGLFNLDGKLEIMLVLYDMLNDDDEEIRQLATAATARLCISSRTERGVIGISSAYISRQRLRRELVREFTSQDTLPYECFRRILGWESDVHLPSLRRNLRRRIAEVDVQQEVEAITAASNDLFAEEKQNLYIDDFAETKAWADMACVIRKDIDGELTIAMNQWAKQGIQALNTHLGASRETKGICHDAALELLIVRTVTIARLTDMPDAELQCLKSTCSSANMPASVVTAFEWLLQRPLDS